MSTVRDEAIKVIENGGMVVVNRQAYTLKADEGVTKGLSELPPLEDFVVGDVKAEAEALKELKKEKADLEIRLAKLEKSTSSSKAEEKEEKEAKKA